eukprot:CAMPEP_0185908126 /NCGR_PEP_ID=MMETSP0196C-20130402/8257_1 /TAXON_ID=2932 /ORGANISM="Alexandrium fundyense, Strain CCMP1719" /LENGTH=35 /DNA_ID= /DNA_START= /DNA_END= /DNA_ORIENTATION=
MTKDSGPAVVSTSNLTRKSAVAAFSSIAVRMQQAG